MLSHEMSIRPTFSSASAVLLATVLSLGGCTPDVTPEPAQVGDYGEQHRPQFHFTPPRMWMNDPNGLVYFDGEYHLFYQYYPDDTVWGPMHWGHAVSRDLVHWEHLPIALYPDERGYIFSGSAVVDWQNTSGFGVEGVPPLVAIFTYHDAERGRTGSNDHETQGIAYSNDRGRSWTKYDGNPVLPNAAAERDFRDPNVIWHEPTGRWIMVLSVGDHVEFWGSPDLKAWVYLSDFGAGIGAHGGVWECPDLFELAVGGSGERRWVLIQNLNPGGPQGGSGTQYFIGDFDGERFTLDESFARRLDEEGPAWLDWGRENYAGVTWSDIPDEDGRRIFIGWMSNWDYAQVVPTSPWLSAMTVPRTLALASSGNGLRLRSSPVAELETLRETSVELDGRTIAGRVDITGSTFAPTSLDASFTFDLDGTDAGEFGLELSNRLGERYRLLFDRAGNRFVSDRRESGNDEFSDLFADRVHAAPRHSRSGQLELRVLIDVASIEVFADNGTTVLTDIFFPTTAFDTISLYADGGDAQLVAASVHRLDGIW